MSDDDQPPPHADAMPAGEIVDARNLLCPMPVIRTSERVATLAPGDVLTVLATDPGTLHDVPAWCRVHGHTLLETHQDGREIRLQLRVEAG